ncbi:MAG: ABC transporter substrate-binding protein [Pseudomonadota bacterium]
MKSIWLFLSCIAITASAGARPNYIDAPPLKDVVKTPVGEVRGDTLRVPLITWGGDIATIVANGGALDTQTGSTFAAAGIRAKLVREDVFVRQLERYLTGETPLLRGTVGMLNLATDALASDPRVKPVVIYQLTWSAGGDALVVKSSIRTASDLRGKTIALQAYGPHVDYLAKILTDAGLKLTDVTLRWLPDLTGTDNSPMAALYENDIDAALTIIPDALALTSGGTVGTGGEDSVKGARILLSTKTANRIIADVYAVRADYFEANRDRVQAFVGALFKAERELASIVANRDGDAERFRATMRSAAQILLDSPEAIGDAEGLYADAEFARLRGNTQFFADANHPRRLEKLNQEAQGAFAAMGLTSGSSVLASAGWNYGRLSVEVGEDKTAESPRFDKDQVASLVTRKQQRGSLGEGELFRFEVFFKPNQKTFAEDLYADSFDRVIELASTYGGAIITVEGHSDPLGYLRKKSEKAPAVVLGQIKQSARNLSIGRAQSVRDSIISYANRRSITLDPSQFAVVGHGIAQPATGICNRDPCAPKNEQEWRSNMRVEFRILQVEAEESVFKPLGE